MTTTNITPFNSSFALKDYLFAQCPNISPVPDSSTTSSYQNITNQANLMLSSLSFWATDSKFKNSITSTVNAITALNPFNFCQTVDECNAHVDKLFHRLENVKTAISNKNPKSTSYIDFTVSPFKNDGPYSHLKVLKTKQTSEWLSQVNEGLAENRLSLIKAGCSGNFFVMNSSGEKIALIKPQDFTWGGKEAFKPCPAKTDVEMKDTVKKELAASSLFGDFFSIPKTYAININMGGKTRAAILQEYIDSVGDMNSYLSSTFYNALSLLGYKELIDSTGINMTKFNPGIASNIHQSGLPQISHDPIFRANMYFVLDELFHKDLVNYEPQKKLYDSFSKENVQRTGLLRLILGDSDINEANFLVTKKSNGQKNIESVDFNLALRNNPLDFEGLALSPWYSSHFTYEPFSDEIKTYLKDLDIKSLALRLEEIGLPKINIAQFVVRTFLIQKAAHLGYNLHQLTTVFFRQDLANYQRLVGHIIRNAWQDSYSFARNIDNIISISSDSFDDQFIHDSVKNKGNSEMSLAFHNWRVNTGFYKTECLANIWKCVKDLIRHNFYCF